MQSWDDHQVNKFIEGVGNGKVWLQYAKKCLEEGIDGKTLANMDVDDLIQMGFTKPHAKAVLADRDAILSVRVVLPRESSVVTEVELAEMRRLGLHRELLGQSASLISAALKNLPATIVLYHSRIDEATNDVISKWEQARVSAHDKLDVEATATKRCLEQALVDIAENQKSFEAKFCQIAALCSAPMSVTDGVGLDQRQTQVMALAQQCLSAPFTTLSRGPEWRVECVKPPASMPLVDLVWSPCATVSRCSFPPLSISVQAHQTSASISWSPQEDCHLSDSKFEYRMQLARTGARPEGAPYEDVYQGEHRACMLSHLTKATSYCLRLRIESQLGCGPWNSVSFSTLDLRTLALSSVSQHQSKAVIGERLFPLVRDLQPRVAAKITGMLLEMDNADLFDLLANGSSLQDKVAEAIEVLEQYECQEEPHSRS